jgi:hypothetical protein
LRIERRRGEVQVACSRRPDQTGQEVASPGQLRSCPNAPRTLAAAVRRKLKLLRGRRHSYLRSS